MELLNFDNIREVLEEYANEVRNLYQDKLIEGDRIASGDLLNTVEYQVTQGDTDYVVSLTLQDYWKYIEYGLRGENNPDSPFKNPGWKAFPAIMDWVKVKPVIPRPGKDKKLPSQKSLAFLITRSIVKNGTLPGEELKDTLEEVNAKYREKLVIAMKKDSQNIMRVIVGGISGEVPGYEFRE